MKKKLLEQFNPYNYTQQLYQSLHNLRQTRSMEEYSDKFYQLVVRIDLMESSVGSNYPLLVLNIYLTMS